MNIRDQLTALVRTAVRVGPGMRLVMVLPMVLAFGKLLSALATCDGIWGQFRWRRPSKTADSAGLI